MTTEKRFDVALIHYPVLNRKNEIIASAVTNLDLHDIARAGRTFGVGTYWVVTPDAQQQELAGQIVDHWTTGYGGSVNPDRAGALSLVRICNNLDEVIAAMHERNGRQPMVVATSADRQDKPITCGDLQAEIEQGTPVLLIFGTAWGLAPEVMQSVDATLPPINGPGEFNHLSVRSAAAIYLDRLFGNRDDTAKM
ncbi:MAG: RNA methyltransferase [Thermodesulfobacteriota bacterium]|nr:RNA methyltransferase [Thermodesulfobacteriota bacterium]